MTASPQPEASSDVVARRIQEVRRRRGWSAERLAEECAKVGAAQITAEVIGNIERGRRDQHGRRRRTVSVDELLVLAVALNVAPTHLLVPLDDEQPYQVTPTRVEPAGAVRDWIRGAWPLGGVDLRDFYSEVPEHEFLEPGRIHVAGQLGSYLDRRAKRLSPADEQHGPPEEYQ
jgi:transcriptional regulator with XRE-family HTH domain